MVPAPTPYVPAEYSTLSAGTFNGEPLVEVLHSYPHFGSDDYEPTAEYGTSVAGFFGSVVVVGLILTSCMWALNCFACCKCCRDMLPCCFDIFNHRPMRGKVTVIVLFLIAAIVSTTSYAGRNEFNAAIFEAGEEMRSLGETFEDLETSAGDLVTQADTIEDATEASSCNDDSTTASLESASTSFSAVSSAISTLLDGLSDELNDAADRMEEEIPPYVDLGLALITVLVWLNVVLGVIAILTEHCKCDDMIVIFLGSITLLLLIFLVGFELTLTVSMADFCYKTPEESILLLSSGRMITYYMQCVGSNPLSDQFDVSRGVVDTYRETLQTIESSPTISCDDSELTIIETQNNATEVTLDFMEDGSGCSVITPRFQAIFHGIICDEAIRGLFLCFMVHAISGLVLVFTFCVFPCAANTKPRFKDAAHMAKHARGKKKNAIEPEVAVPVAASEMDRSEDKEAAKIASADVENNAPAPAPAADYASTADPPSSEPVEVTSEVSPPEEQKKASEVAL